MHTLTHSHTHTQELTHTHARTHARTHIDPRSLRFPSSRPLTPVPEAASTPGSPTLFCSESEQGEGPLRTRPHLDASPHLQMHADTPFFQLSPSVGRTSHVFLFLLLSFLFFHSAILRSEGLGLEDIVENDGPLAPELLGMVIEVNPQAPSHFHESSLLSQMLLNTPHAFTRTHAIHMCIHVPIHAHIHIHILFTCAYTHMFITTY